MKSDSPYPRPHLRRFLCPRCGEVTRRVLITSWGDFVTPYLTNLTKCDACGFQYNRYTRKELATGKLLLFLLGALSPLIFYGLLMLFFVSVE